MFAQDAGYRTAQQRRHLFVSPRFSRVCLPQTTRSLFHPSSCCLLSPHQCTGLVRGGKYLCGLSQTHSLANGHVCPFLPFAEQSSCEGLVLAGSRRPEIPFGGHSHSIALTKIGPRLNEWLKLQEPVDARRFCKFARVLRGFY